MSKARVDRTYKIAVLPGDGVGAEVIREATKALRAIGSKYGLKFEFSGGLVGGSALDTVGEPIPAATMEVCRSSDAILFGAVGGPKWDKLDWSKRPEVALFTLRKEFGLFANLRPAKLHRALIDASPLKPELVKETDIMVVRELTGGIYFGEPRGIGGRGGAERGFNTLSYTRSEIERIARVAFELASKRRKSLASVDKSNVLETMVLWRRVVEEMGRGYPKVELRHILVDNCAMQLIRDPRQFDVLLADNMFGDILSDEAAMLTGSIGMLPSASLGGKIGLYEPVHGSAPDIQGQDIANPIAAIASAAMMLRHSFDLEDEASKIESAIDSVLHKEVRTKDIYQKGCRLVGTAEMGDLICGAIQE